MSVPTRPSPPPLHAAEPALGSRPMVVMAATALAYASLGLAALLLAGPPGYASPLYPPTGIALAAVLIYGRAALPGVLLGGFMVNLSLGALRGQTGLSTLLLPLAVGLGAMLQAWAGAGLVRRYVTLPLVLNAPRDILRFSLLGALAACVLSASIATPALLAAGAIGPEVWLSNWFTWWMGDTLGVLIGTPLALTLIGRPRADWKPRRRTLGLPLLLALALVATGMLEFSRLDRQRQQAAFERDADRLAGAAQARLSAPLHALQALHSAARAHGTLDGETLHQAARWWLEQPFQLLGMGYGERVPLDQIAALEAAARAEGLSQYRVFDRDDGSARATDGAVLAVRRVEPVVGNASALGVNSLSVPEARAAVLATRDHGEPAATAGFRLTQSAGDETGVVIYQALYRGDPRDEAGRRAAFRGVVFVTVRTDQALAGVTAADQRYLSWCLLDADPGVSRRRLAGSPGCERQAVHGAGADAQRMLDLGGRAVELRIHTDHRAPGHQREATWLLSMASLAAAAMLGALLLTVTGHTRRTELAVQAGTAELRREIGERTHAEEALRESEARLRSILDHVPLGVMFLDPDGFLLECNPRLAEMLSSSQPALRGRLVGDFVHPDEASRVRRLHRELLAGRGDQTLDCVRLLDARGGEPLMRLSASALHDPAGRLLRFVCVVEDITEHLRLQESEQALHRAEAANRAKSEFLSRMSHELRTPLNAMIGFAQLLGLDREPGLVTHQREWTQQIQRAGWHLLEMINETLDLARIESGAVQLNLTPVALGPLVAASQAMLATAASQRGVTINDLLGPDAPTVLGDATRLKQVLTNLLSNAVKYNRAGGSVSVCVRRVPGALADSVELEVADTGLGMTPEQLAALFQPYNRLGRENSGIEGTGIGLVISRRLTELMGGTLDARSDADRGSVFTLRLPATAPAELPVQRYTDTSPAPYQQRLVHYVEDNETNIEVMRGVFAQRAQIRLETSMLGLDGLAAIRASRPDLVLLDMHLPDISGLELLRHLKQDEAMAAIPVLVVSADATTLQIQQALTSGALHYITKPLDVARFLATVDSILEAVETRWGM